jgi:hypothetical protein
MSSVDFGFTYLSMDWQVDVFIAVICSSCYMCDAPLIVQRERIGLIYIRVIVLNATYCYCNLVLYIRSCIINVDHTYFALNQPFFYHPRASRPLDVPLHLR